MKHRKGMEANLGMVLIITVVIGMVLVLVTTGMLSGGLGESGEQAKDTIETDALVCPTVCFQCCNGIENPGRAFGGTCETPAPGDPYDEIRGCNCKC